MIAYLDNSATTRCLPAAADIMRKVLTEDYGNASSMHQKGVDAEKYIRQATADISKTLRCRESEIIYTSGGTESNNTAIIGAALANKRLGKHIITTAVEHDSVKETVRFLGDNGYDITVLPVDGNGIIDLEELKAAVRQDTVIVSVMMINNEMGAVMPVQEAAAVVHEKNPDTLFHADAVQAYGKLKIIPERMGIDLLSASGHKIHGPKGVGFLYIKKGTKIKPVTFGGGQQGGMRSGTVNVPGIAGLGEAAREACSDMNEKMLRLNELKLDFAQSLSAIEGVYLNGDPMLTAPHIVNASFTGIRSEVLLHSLEERGIYVSSGSACAVHHKGRSNTLEAMRLPAGRKDSAIRFSFCEETTKEELDYTLGALGELVPVLRKYKRR